MTNEIFTKLNKLGFEYNITGGEILKQILLFFESRGIYIDRHTSCSSNEILGFDMIVTGYNTKAPYKYTTNDYIEGYLHCIEFILNQYDTSKINTNKQKK